MNPTDRPLTMAMLAPDDFVLSFTYVDSKGTETHRVVSPIRFVDKDRFLGLCLSREEPRTFYIQRCTNMKIERAEEFLMPVPLEAVSPPKDATL